MNFIAPLFKLSVKSTVLACHVLMIFAFNAMDLRVVEIHGDYLVRAYRGKSISFLMH
jgi:non-ribosomal peptide synthetase component F